MDLVHDLAVHPVSPSREETHLEGHPRHRERWSDEGGWVEMVAQMETDWHSEMVRWRQIDTARWRDGDGLDGGKSSNREIGTARW